ncbi:glycerophosphodiester phosphodiesterase [Rhodocyclus tenuis]|uniref:Glycerophosphoryl diester phosphodiesterase n=1 Tax=Rhodocyclus tenuis TaxID=1066 RepID=A0A840GH16_RHOTE|nr:glycerophosphodiester phosphodiesterase [Rhodocyclus tenuis]MBB4247792.1 glycerophosphoryl diester phosphodiesterase [Rhodocyclus tenuis]
MIRPAPAWPLPRLFAHRCGGALAPENTLAGLVVAARLGCRAVEFDVMLSADGTPWLIHDETLERTTDGSGRVAATPDVLLAKLDAGIRQHPAFSGEPVPTLAAAAALCRRLGLQANVEIKPASGYEALTGEVVARAIGELWRDSAAPLVSSFSFAALAAARCVAPQLPLGCLWTQPPADWRAPFDELRAFSVHCAAEGLSDNFLVAASAAGAPVLCYTVNDAEQAAALWRRGVSALFSDRPERLLPAAALHD